MSVYHWTDFHSWPIRPETMQAAQIALPPPQFQKLFCAGERVGNQFDVPREAIEAAALAMPPGLAVQFLGAVYDLNSETAAKVLVAIMQTHGR